jgi:RNA polymerase sigma-70 factor (ECF subfamily)
VTCENGNAGGSRRAQEFVEFVRRTENELRGWIQRHVGCSDQTQEILQKSFCEAWASRTFDPKHAHARAWIFTTAKHLIINTGGERSASISLDDLSQRVGMDGSRSSRSAVLVDPRIRDPMTEIIANEESQTFEVALEMLSEEHRDVLERYYLKQEGKQHQIAEALGLSIAAFNSRLNRARKELKGTLIRLRRNGE